MQQHFSNHKRYHPLFHFVLLPLSMVGLVAACVKLFTSPAGCSLGDILAVLAFFLLFNIAGLARIYSLKVQDRVIRLEENFRHYLLTGKQLDGRLRSGQIVALRFASDAEFPGLAIRAASEDLSPKQIKESITDWRADHRRV